MEFRFFYGISEDEPEDYEQQCKTEDIIEI